MGLVQILSARPLNCLVRGTLVVSEWPAWNMCGTRVETDDAERRCKPRQQARIVDTSTSSTRDLVTRTPSARANSKSLGSMGHQWDRLARGDLTNM